MTSIESNSDFSIFQAGVILGRITQICVDRGIVTSGPGMGLSDFLGLFSEELKCLPLSENLTTQLLDEIQGLSESLASYRKDDRIDPDDARIMISLVSRWTDKILDEFITAVPTTPETQGNSGADE